MLSVRVDNTSSKNHGSENLITRAKLGNNSFHGNYFKIHISREMIFVYNDHQNQFSGLKEGKKKQLRGDSIPFIENLKLNLL